MVVKSSLILLNKEKDFAGAGNTCLYGATGGNFILELLLVKDLGLETQVLQQL